MIQSIENLLSHVSVDDIANRIIKFEAELPALSVEELPAKIKDAILFDYNGMKFSSFQSEAREYQKGGVFYRVRRLAPSTSKLEKSDFWEPPKNVISYGRLNKPGEQLLYLTACEPLTPIKEVNILEDEPFLLTCYISTDVIKVLGLGFKSNFTADGLSKDSLTKLQLITSFIDRNFLSDRESAYIVSSIIASDICDFNYDGWVYPSVANEGGENTCLKLSAKNKLKIEAAFICRLDGEKFRPIYSIAVDEDIQVFNDWDSENSIAESILNNLSRLNRESFSISGQSQITLRDDIGFPTKWV